MLPAYSVFENEKEAEISHVGSAISRVVSVVPWTDAEQAPDSLYRQLVYKVRRSPRRLMCHLQRVNYCFNNKLSEQLYAALIDLFYVLKGQGCGLSERISLEVSVALSEEELLKIHAYLATYDETLLIGNRYSLFTTGQVNALCVIKEAAKVNTEYDVLTLARDYVEYSQLDQAMEVLEAGIIEMPERLELQSELLELYTITKRYSSYKKMTNQLQNYQIDITTEWQNAAKYFAELNDDE